MGGTYGLDSQPLFEKIEYPIFYKQVTMNCQGRITCDETKQQFGDGKHNFYIEERCGLPAIGPLCPKCDKSEKNGKKELKYQASRRFDHGLIGEAYTENSHLFDSPWYHQKRKAYGEPSKESLEIAMRAKKVAMGNSSVSSGSVSSGSTTTPKKILKKPSVPYLPSIPRIVPTCCETTDEPLAVREVERVVFVPFEHEGKSFWKCGEKIYENVNGCLGPAFNFP